MVLAVSPCEEIVEFEERGAWDKSGIQFYNRSRWTLKPGRVISLEHFRRGLESPVHLQDFYFIGNARLESRCSYRCGEDSYKGDLVFGDDAITLCWTVLGPKKNYKTLICYNC